ncbi:ATP-binding protein [Massilia antarctica]|uniref:ATP-binding protein n=1 Tax=Massilia antarctica TaxID=2765360 RepID=A0AA48WBA8_9BURK|nr:ATP-binding protein [Massilia antarctica]QPI48568.1 ATP-binding protein [Massilia antarctica]
MIADALAAFAPELARLDALILHEIGRLRARYELSLDELRGLYISDRQVDELVRAGQAADAAPMAAIDIGALRQAAAPSPWTHLARALALDDDERDLVLVCLAPELDPKYETLYAYLNNDVSRKWPNAELAARLLGQDGAHRVALRGLLAPESRLAASGAIEVVPGQRELPRAQRELRLAAAVAGWLQGLPYVDERLVGVARASHAEAVLPADALHPEAQALLGNAARALDQGVALPPLVLVAATAGDAALAAQDMFVRAHCPALVLDLAALAGAAAPAKAFNAAELMQRVLGIGIAAAPLDALFDPELRPLETIAAPLRRLASRSPALLLAATAGVHWRELLPDTLALEIRLADLDTRGRARLWRAALDTQADSAPVEALADRFALGPGRIRQAAAAARHAATLAGDSLPSAAQLFSAARAASLDGAGGTTRAIGTPFDWDDLVVPPDVRRRLADLLSAIELRYRVLDEWGFGARIGGARGIKVMFAGASGTGKTMAAAIIAKTLQLELQRIELAAVISKYIGETEKNLDRAFAAAHRANAVLFLDEADALLGKRAEVKDAHDRYANIETAYLLQKMEEHEGIVILATNLARNIDEAFSRRMQFVVEFPHPDGASRERLWRGMFPATAPTAPDLDFAFLARQFPLTGGDIRNIVLDAAYHAAQEQAAIGLGHALRAIARQYAKRGKVPTVAEFREHYGMLMQEPDLARPAAGDPAALDGHA